MRLPMGTPFAGLPSGVVTLTAISFGKSRKSFGAFASVGSHILYRTGPLPEHSLERIFAALRKVTSLWPASSGVLLRIYAFLLLFFGILAFGCCFKPLIGALTKDTPEPAKVDR